MAVVGEAAPGKEPWENIMERSDAKCRATELYFKGSALRGRSDSAKFGKPFRSFKADGEREKVLSQMSRYLRVDGPISNPSETVRF